jgi:hypothetical protein
MCGVIVSTNGLARCISRVGNCGTARLACWNCSSCCPIRRAVLVGVPHYVNEEQSSFYVHFIMNLQPLPADRESRLPCSPHAVSHAGHELTTTTCQVLHCGWKLSPAARRCARANACIGCWFRFRFRYVLHPWTAKYSRWMLGRRAAAFPSLFFDSHAAEAITMFQRITSVCECVRCVS